MSRNPGAVLYELLTNGEWGLGIGRREALDVLRWSRLHLGEDSMDLVVVESPFAGDVDLNVRYARACLADCLAHGEAPYASHLLYPQPGVLRDDVAAERRKGILAGFAWAAYADCFAFYCDLGMSGGMRDAMLNHARASDYPIELRLIGEDRPDGFDAVLAEAMEHAGVQRVAVVHRNPPTWSPCTGTAARWCPVHGDCECSEEQDYNDERCPLHSSKSLHAPDELWDRR